MKGIKEIIAGIGFLISGALGVAIGNLEETLFYSSGPATPYKHAVTYYLFMFFIVVGCIYNIKGFMKKND